MTDGGIKMGMTPPHPGTFIRIEGLEELGLSVTTAARILGVRRAVHPPRRRGDLPAQGRAAWRGGGRHPGADRADRAHPGEKWGEVHATLHGDLATIVEWTGSGGGKGGSGTPGSGLSVSAKTGTVLTFRNPL